MSTIKRLEFKNWIGIKELVFSPGKINKISGDSGSGKTSIIEGFEKGFTNKSRRTEVIRHDEAEAELFVELDDGLQITRKIRSEKGDYLKVKHDSKSVASTESFLKKLISGDIFRPIEFVQKDAKEQAEIILNMLDIAWTADDILNWFEEMPEADYQLHILKILKAIETGYYSERESINREVNLLRANIEGIKKDLPANYDGEEWKNVNLQSLYNKLSTAEESNKKLGEAEKLIEGLNIRIDDIKQRSANAKESKKLEYSRQSDMLKSSIDRLEENIQTEQSKVDEVGFRINQSSMKLDDELQQAIERLKLQYQAKKQAAKEDIQQEGEQMKTFISEYKEQLSEKKSTKANLVEHEKKDLEKIADREVNLIQQENDKSGNAQAVIDSSERIDVEPLKTNADKAAEMKEYLREWERMNDIIKDKLSPKEARSAELTNKIQKARELPKELLKTASIPVEGLTVDEKGRIRINDTLIDGLSEGEALDFAFKLAKAQAGDLKVICVDSFQNLGSKQLKILEDAMTDEYQYFILSTEQDQELKIEVLGGN